MQVNNNFEDCGEYIRILNYDRTNGNCYGIDDYIVEIEMLDCILNVVCFVEEQELLKSGVFNPLFKNNTDVLEIDMYKNGIFIPENTRVAAIEITEENIDDIANARCLERSYSYEIKKGLVFDNCVYKVGDFLVTAYNSIEFFVKKEDIIIF